MATTTKTDAEFVSIVQCGDGGQKTGKEKRAMKSKVDDDVEVFFFIMACQMTPHTRVQHLLCRLNQREPQNQMPHCALSMQEVNTASLLMN